MTGPYRTKVEVEQCICPTHSPFTIDEACPVHAVKTRNALLSDHEKRIARIERQLGITLGNCHCGNGPPAEWEGPLIDCPVHGEPAPRPEAAASKCLRCQGTGEVDSTSQFVGGVSDSLERPSKVKPLKVPCPVCAAPRPDSEVEAAEVLPIERLADRVIDTWHQASPVSPIYGVRNVLAQQEAAVRADERRKCNVADAERCKRDLSNFDEIHEEVYAENDVLRTKLEAAEREIERLRADKGCARREALLCSKHEECWLDKVIDGCGWCQRDAAIRERDIAWKDLELKLERVEEHKKALDQAREGLAFADSESEAAIRERDEAVMRAAHRAAELASVTEHDERTIRTLEADLDAAKAKLVAAMKVVESARVVSYHTQCDVVERLQETIRAFDATSSSGQ